jgi:uncharacterized damage-inducible protein DinB
VKALLEQYAAYNIWANQRLIDTILLLPEEKLQQPLISSFPSLHATLLHMWDAESIWWQRLKMHDNVSRPSEQFKGGTRDVGAALLHQNKLWQSWIENASLAALEHVFHYQNSKKEKFRQPTFEMLLHLCNHATYHRGQLVTMLRNVGVESIPATDFIVYSRRKK